ncbi:MAG: DUF4115 domain-containing protein [Xanthomonadales bacterium]|nr:DUF4115 domain-containing protein [Xanthomonadales bacterium]
MTEETTAETITAADPQDLGARLKAKREQGGWSVQEIATDLRLTSTSVRDLEAGRWEQLGAPVYVRGYLKAYGRRVDVDVADWTTAIPEAVPESRPIPIAAARRRWRGYSKLASYLVATALLAIPAVVGVIRAFQVPEIASSVASPNTTLASMTPMPAPRVDRDEPAAELASTDLAGPLPASVQESEPESGPDAVDVPKATPVELVLELNEQVWLDVTDLEGERLAFGLQEAGTVLRFSLAEGIHARVGNADAVVAQIDGTPFDLAPHMVRDVAEFDLAARSE